MSPWDLLFWGALLLGAVACAWQIANDDGGSASKRQQYLEQRLARYPASARAVIIKGRPGNWWRWLPPLALPVIIALAVPHAGKGLAAVCDRIGIAETGRWLLLFVFPGIPALLALPTAFIVAKAMRILRGGYAPPLDAVLAHDTIAVAGWRARLQGVLGLIVMPSLVLWTGCLAYDLRTTFDARPLTDQTRCPASFSLKSGFSR